MIAVVCFCNKNQQSLDKLLNVDEVNTVKCLVTQCKVADSMREKHICVPKISLAQTTLS